MRPLSARDILKVWEWGQGRHPVDRALGSLAFAFPELPWGDLLALSIGQRDICLLTLYEQTFSDKIQGIADCPRCGERLEFTQMVSELQVNETRSEGGTPQELVWEDFILQFRIPNSTDLAAIAGCKDVPAARRLLARRCVLKASRKGKSVPPSKLTSKIIGCLAARMAECDPQAEVLLDLVCPACRHSWQLMLDIATYLWAEINAYAVRLLQEVHALAATYGWDEGRILGMSPQRRQWYLAMVTT